MDLAEGGAWWWRRRGLWAGLGAVAAVLAVGWLAPAQCLRLTRMIGYGLCHQLPQHSFRFAGQPFPLCARCTGSFVGFALTATALVVSGRARRSGLPPRGLWVALGAGVLAVAVDGANSYIDLISNSLVHLYPPSNLLRFATGSLYGGVLAVAVLPVFAGMLWAIDDARPCVTSYRSVAGLAGMAAVATLVVSEAGEALAGPLALGGGLGAVLVLVLVNATAVMLATGRGRRAHRWRDAIVPLLVGLALAAVELAALSGIRAAMGPLLLPG